MSRTSSLVEFAWDGCFSKHINQRSVTPRHRRDGPPVVSEIRPGLRPRIAPPGGPARRSVASGRGFSPHQRSIVLRKRLKGLRDVSWVIITDPLKSDEAAHQAWMPGVEHRQHPGLNHRAALSHPPTRQQERPMPRFRSPGPAQRVLSAQGPMNHLFHPRRHRMAAAEYRAVRIQAFDTGQQVTRARKAG